MNKPIGNRVLMLLENNPYPNDSRVRKEATSLVDAGYQVTVISPKTSEQNWYDTVDMVQVYRYPFMETGSGLLSYAWEYGYSLVSTFIISLYIFLNTGFDIIHAHNPPDTFVFIAAFYKLFGKRFVFDHHDLSPELYKYGRFGSSNQLVYQVLVWLEKLSCSLADIVIATNESYRAMEIERGRVPEENIMIVRNGPDPNIIRLTAPDPELRQKANTIIGYVGIIGFQDGLDYLLRALKHLIYDLGRTDVFCVIIGSGDALSTLKELAVKLNVQEYIWFTGRLTMPDVVRLLSTADICVDPDPSNPYNDRCTMIKMTEYMALERPIVAFDLPEHRFTAQKAALYVPPNDELKFAQALIQLIDDPARCKEMGTFGRQRIESHLAWSYSQKNLLEAYRRLSSKPGWERMPNA